MKQNSGVKTALIAQRIFDGHTISTTNGEQALLIENDTIRRVGSLESVRKYFDNSTRILNFGDATISPGFIDTHVHATLPGDGSHPQDERNSTDSETRIRQAKSNLRTHLACGVTTVRDLGSHADFLLVQLDRHLYPRVIKAGPPVTPIDGHMHFFGGGYEEPSNIKKLVDFNVDRGAEVIKIAGSGGGTYGNTPHATTIDKKSIREIVASAQARGVKTTTHALSKESMKYALDAGINGIEHLGFLEENGQSIFDEHLVKYAAKKRVFFGSTLSVNRKIADFVSPDDPELIEQKEKNRYYLENARLIRESGGQMAVASDAGWKYTFFGDFAYELELLTRAGYAAKEVMKMATHGNATYLGICDSVGTLQPGYLADIAVFQGNPTENITHTKNPVAVFRNGFRAHYIPF